MRRPKRSEYLRTQEELLDRIMDAIARGDQGDEFNEYMKQACFIPLRLRSVYFDVDEGSSAYSFGDMSHKKKNCECQNVWLHPEPNTRISEVAKQYLPFMERAVRRGDGPRFTSIAAQFRSWKWLLGHPDADFFFDVRDPKNLLGTYLALRGQIASGLWDRMTANAMKGRTSETDQRSTALKAA